MKVKELLATPDTWIRGVWAKDKSGWNTSPHHSDACCWCLIGAVKKCYGDNWEMIFHRIKMHLNLPREYSLFRWNDEASFDKVKQLVDTLDI